MSISRTTLLALLAGAAFGTAFLGDLGGPASAGTSAIRVDELLQIPVNATGGTQALLVVNTADRKMFVYRMDGGIGGGRLMLNANRDYKYDLILDEWPPSKGRGGNPTSAELRKIIADDNDEYKKAKKEEKKTVDDWVNGKLQKSEGATLLATVNPSPGQDQQFDHIYLTDKGNKKILVYKMDGDKLWLVAARKYEYDEKLPDSADYTAFESFENVKRKWEAWKKKKDEEEKRNKKD